MPTKDRDALALPKVFWLSGGMGHKHSRCDGVTWGQGAEPLPWVQGARERPAAGCGGAQPPPQIE